MNWALVRYCHFGVSPVNYSDSDSELGRVVLVRDFIGPSGLVRVVFGPSCPAPITRTPASGG